MTCAVNSELVSKVITPLTKNLTWRVQKVINNTVHFEDKAVCLFKQGCYWCQINIFSEELQTMYLFALDEFNCIDFDMKFVTHSIEDIVNELYDLFLE